MTQRKIKNTKNTRKSHTLIKGFDCVKLGYAWSGNSINQVIYRCSGLITNNENQIAAYYLSNKIIRVVKRNLNTNEIAHHDISGEYDINDAHNSISIGVDRRGYCHLAYGCHATKLKYRRGLIEGGIFDWTDEMSMTGLHENHVTYPTFIGPFDGTSLIFLYRDGFHNCGSARIKKYDELTKEWNDSDDAILSGVNQKPFSCNAYWNNPVIDNVGVLHLTFVWRYATANKSLVHNVNICYAKSLDGGLTWRKASGEVYKLPITPDAAEVIQEITAGNNLINQCSMATDCNNDPHVVFYANDEKEVPQYQYLRMVEGKWVLKIISKRSKKFNIFGRGSLHLPISRPEIVIDKNNYKFVIYRDDVKKTRMKLSKIFNDEILAHEVLVRSDIGSSEPVVDKSRWREENVLSLLVQKTKQPNQDINVKDAYSQIRIMDFKII